MEAVLSMATAFSIAISDASHASAARIAVQRVARDLEFDETRIGRASILVTEAVTNMLKHAQGGTLAVRPFTAGNVLALEILAIDSGPGMNDLAHSTRDGISTTATAGTGLGAMRRLADELDVCTEPGRGTIVRMALGNRPLTPASSPSDYDVGAVCVSKPGESVSGDAWGMQITADGLVLVVADGLGHGPDACRASSTAVSVLREHAGDSAIRLLDRMHGQLRATRGAAVAVMRHERASGELAFAGVGNIGGCILHGETRQMMVSHNGIVGHNVHKSHEFRYPWRRGGQLVAYSDGLESGWDPARVTQLSAHHPSIAAAALFREHSRGRDDTVVLVARLRA
jgi:anti-sigma regulatory factor (Ser/Thr protein kinase)